MFSGHVQANCNAMSELRHSYKTISTPNYGHQVMTTIQQSLGLSATVTNEHLPIPSLINQ